MALYHYTAQTEGKLVDLLTDKLTAQNSVFTPQWIITGHNATNNYLIEQIASKNGIAANIKFKQVIPLIEMIHHTLNLAPERNNLIRNEQLVWFIDEVLQSDGFKAHKAAEKVTNYIGDEPQKRFTLAEKISALFSSYQEETPILISAWNTNELITDKTDEVWQSYIWRALKDRFGDGLRDLTTLFQDIASVLEDETQRTALKNYFPALFLYGNLPYSQQLIDLLQSLSKVIDIYVFRRTFITQDENPIIKNLGTVLQRDTDLWKAIPAKNEESSEKSTYHSNLFGLLKQNLLDNEKQPVNFSKADDSLVIASTYSVGREVEALYHHLIHLFKDNQGLNAKDVIVIVPDIETYAPVIKTYFDYTIKEHGNENPLIPYTIYDTSHRVYASPYSALEALLGVEKDSFTSKNVMKLLDFDFIRERFGFTGTEVLIRALDKANIRHGFSGDSELQTDLVSWQYGLKRLIYGFCLPPETGKVTFDSTTFFPIDAFEESERFELIKLYHFIETLHNWLEQRAVSRTLADWITFLEKQTLDIFISEQSHDTSMFRRLLGQLNHVVQQGLNLSYNFQVMRYYVKGALGNMETSDRSGYGGVRFVSPSIFLSVPAKVYAFLGLNSADFPRKVTKVSFDLSDENRLTKTDYDKNLFLSLLLAAEDKIYLSYIGNSIKDNSEIPPSSLIGELEAHMIGLLETHIETLTLRHPLHSFNSRYNQDNNPLLINFELSNHKTENIIDTSIEKNSPELPFKKGKKVIQLKDLTNFIEDPVKHYFTKTLGVYMSERDINLAESELFELDSLQNWKVKDAFIRAKQENREVEELELKMMGDLPLSKIGMQIFQKLKDDVKPIIENDQLTELFEKPVEQIAVEIELNDFILEGRIGSIYGDSFLFLTSSNNKAKYQIRALVNFYAAFLEGNVNHLYYLFKGGKSRKMNKVQSDKKEIQELLEKWCQIYEEGLEELICFDSSFISKASDIENIIQKAEESRPFDLNTLVLYKTILNSFEKSVFPSEYFCYIAQNDGFSNSKKTTSFLNIFQRVNELITPLK